MEDYDADAAFARRLIDFDPDDPARRSCQSESAGNGALQTTDSVLVRGERAR